MTTSELGAFLRARREALQPADVGMPTGGRRRTPGLRREEVAARAGVSIDYLIRLEQGRDTNPSAAVLHALADALLLGDDERIHLLELTALCNSAELCPATGAVDAEVGSAVRALLDGFEPLPAFVLGPYGDVLASNAPWRAVVAELGHLDHERPNVSRYVFTHPRARTALVDWDAMADQHVSHLRAASVRWGREPGFVALVDELGAVPEFRSRWSAHVVEEKRATAKRFHHPDAGRLHVASEVLLLTDGTDRQFVTWLPADDATDEALRRLAGVAPAGEPAHLRVVGGG